MDALEAATLSLGFFGGQFYEFSPSCPHCSQIFLRIQFIEKSSILRIGGLLPREPPGASGGGGWEREWKREKEKENDRVGKITERRATRERERARERAKA